MALLFPGFFSPHPAECIIFFPFASQVTWCIVQSVPQSLIFPYSYCSLISCLLLCHRWLPFCEYEKKVVNLKYYSRISSNLKMNKHKFRFVQSVGFDFFAINLAHLIRDAKVSFYYRNIVQRSKQYPDYFKGGSRVIRMKTRMRL